MRKSPAWLVAMLLLGACQQDGAGFWPFGKSQTLAEVEPNDAVANATPIVSPAFVRAPILPNADLDVFSFAARAGDVVYAATMTAVSPASGDTTLELLGSDGTTVLETDTDDGNVSSLASSIAGVVLPAAGTYYLRVRGPGSNQIRPYDLYFQLRSGMPTAEQEPNGSNDTATALSSGWGRGARDPDSDTDVWSLTLAAGDTVFVSLDLDPERDGTTWNGRLGYGLFGDSGDQVLTVNDPNATSPNSEALFFSVKNAGTYYVVVDGGTVDGDPALTYRLNATVLPTSLRPRETCTTYSNDAATAIADLGSATSSILVPGHPRISDLDVAIRVNHPLMQDLDVTLTDPAGVPKVLLTDIGSDGGSGQTQMDIVLDDEAGFPIEQAVLKGLRFQPEAVYRLSWFDGQDAGGTWTLTLYDDTADNAGSLVSWSIRVCEIQPAPGETPFYAADFEAGAAGWTHEGAQDEWELGLPTAAPLDGCNSGSACWKTDLDNTYDGSSSQRLVSPPIAVPDRDAVELSWAMKYQIESASFETLVVRVHDVGGVVPDREVFRHIDANIGMGAVQTVGEPGIVVASAVGWGIHRADISAFAGRTITVTYQLTSDTTVQGLGVAVDDVTLRVLAVCGDGTVSPGESCDDGNSVDEDGCSSLCELADDTPPADGGPTPGDADPGVDPGGDPDAPPGVYIPPERGCAAAPDASLVVLAFVLWASGRCRMRSMFMVAIVGLVSLTACGGKDCNDLCEEGNACEETTDDNIECDEFCGGLATITESNCGKEYDALLECERGSDVCQEGVCETELNALGICALLYCGQDFDEPGCDDVRDGLSG